MTHGCLDYARKEFGRCLKQVREDNDVIQDLLAERLDVSRQMIHKYENGTSIPKAKTMNKLFQMFKSKELVQRYFLIQGDMKELRALSAEVIKADPSLTRWILKQVIKAALKVNDFKTATEVVFQLMMWDLENRNKTYRRKADFVVRAFAHFEPWPEEFAGLLQKLYDISKKANSFDAFITVTEAVSGKLKLDHMRLSRIYYQEATAHYGKGNHDRAYKVSLEAIRTLNGKRFSHTADIFQRHGLICLQIEFHKEAIEHFEICRSMADPSSDLYRLAITGIARSYYMLEDFNEAQRYWDQTFALLDRNSEIRVHSLNDIIMKEIKLGEYDKARSSIAECERLLKIARRKGWKRCGNEELLLRRNKVLLNATETGEYLTSEVSRVLDELEKSYMNDEFKVANKFIHEKLFSGIKMKTTT